MRAALQVVPRGDAQRCPYCHDPLALEGRQSCAGCGALYHRECLVEELGRCAVLGCGAPAPVESDAPFAGAVRALLATVARELPGVELGAPRPDWLRPGEQPLGRIGWGPDALLLSDRGVWRQGELCCDYVQVASVSWGGEGLRLALGADLGGSCVVPVERSPTSRLAALALERVLAPLAGQRQAQLPDRCPLCLKAAGEHVLACDGCGVAYDPACLRERGGCVVPGCRGRRALPRPSRDWFATLGRPRPDVALPPTRPARERCGRCQEGFTRGDASARCEVCGGCVHAGCVGPEARCPTPGCLGTTSVACTYAQPGFERGCGATAVWFGGLVGLAGLSAAVFDGEAGVLTTSSILAGLCVALGVVLLRVNRHRPRDAT